MGDCTCKGPLPDCIRCETERETIARVVAWLRDVAERNTSAAGRLAADVYADAIERGEWKGGEGDG